jgi:hypothetical protein
MLVTLRRCVEDANAQQHASLAAQNAAEAREKGLEAELKSTRLTVNDLQV